jgi:hypothetical protein
VNPVAIALRDKIGFEVVSASEDDGLVLVGRIPDARVADRNAVTTALLAGGSGWSVDFSKWFFLRNGTQRYAWRFIFSFSAPREEVYGAIIRAIGNVRTFATAVGGGPLEEFPLHGVSTSRNAPVNGRGAALFGQGRVGPQR